MKSLISERMNKKIREIVKSNLTLTAEQIPAIEKAIESVYIEIDNELCTSTAQTLPPGIPQQGTVLTGSRRIAERHDLEKVIRVSRGLFSERK